MSHPSISVNWRIFWVMALTACLGACETQTTTAATTLQCRGAFRLPSGDDAQSLDHAVLDLAQAQRFSFLALLHNAQPQTQSGPATQPDDINLTSLSVTVKSGTTICILAGKTAGAWTVPATGQIQAGGEFFASTELVPQRGRHLSWRRLTRAVPCG